MASLWIAGVVGLLVGSAVANLARCWPASLGRWLTGRSRCDGCGRDLGIIDLLPVVGWLLRRGRCRSCGHRISPFYPMVELSAAAIAVASVAVLGIGSGALVAFVGWLLLAMALIDNEHLILPDTMTLPLIVAGVAGALLPGWPGPATADAVLGAITGFASFWLIREAYLRWRKVEGLGLGDAKLFAAAGAWCGWQSLPTILLIAAGIGLVIAFLRGQGLQSREPVPFGGMLAVGFWSGLLLSWTP